MVASLSLTLCEGPRRRGLGYESPCLAIRVDEEGSEGRAGGATPWLLLLLTWLSESDWKDGTKRLNRRGEREGSERWEGRKKQASDSEGALLRFDGFDEEIGGRRRFVVVVVDWLGGSVQPVGLVAGKAGE